MDANRTTKNQRTLVDALRLFLTPALWKKAESQRRTGSHRRSKSSRWMTQPLVLVLLFVNWSGGNSQGERFEIAKGFCQICLAKRRRPGKHVQGFQQALERLPMGVLRVISAGIRQVLPTLLKPVWKVEGYVPIGCDGSRIECPRNEELEKRLGCANKEGSAPMVWVTALVHLTLGIPWAWRLGKSTASERGHLAQMVSLLPEAALLVCDAGFVGFPLARQLMDQTKFLIRMSSAVTLYTEKQEPLSKYKQGIVYYFPAEKDRKENPTLQPLKLRLLRIRRKGCKHHVWLLTNVLEPGLLSRELAGQMYRWRWESEGCFRTYKRTLNKVKLASRTVRQVHREAEGAWLALQLMFAQASLALLPRQVLRQVQPAGCSLRVAVALASSPRAVLLAIRQEMLGLIRRGQPCFWERLQRSWRENRHRTSKKDKRISPGRKPHRTPKPPKILTLTEQQKAMITAGKQTTA